MADYIDRDAAIEALRKFADDCQGSTEAATAAAMGISELSRLPGPWVSTKERLPESGGEYICICGFETNGSIRFSGTPLWIVEFFPDADTPHFELEGAFGLTVAYWMSAPPLPDGISGGQDE